MGVWRTGGSGATTNNGCLDACRVCAPGTCKAWARALLSVGQCMKGLFALLCVPHDDVVLSVYAIMVKCSPSVSVVSCVLLLKEFTCAEGE